MKHLALLALSFVSASALAQVPVSAFNFDATLVPFIDNNPGNVTPLNMFNGGNLPTLIQPTYSSATVGNVTKQVLNIAANDNLFANHGVGKNGGGSYVNQYSILFDIKFDTRSNGSYSSLFNTAVTNGNDGDSFLLWGANGSATVGISGSYAGSISGDAWHRLIVGVDQTNNLITYYLNGAQIHQATIAGGADGRWSLYSYDDGDANSDGLYILGDEDGDSGSGQLSQLAFFDHVLSSTEVQNLGGVGQPVPEPASMIALGLGAAAMLRRRRKA